MSLAVVEVADEYFPERGLGVALQRQTEAADGDQGAENCS